MFDLTVLPYFVFAFMAIPPFIFGYFKGWRSGLFTVILTLITGGILVGISVGIYESALWPLFKGLFVTSHNPGNLDVESLKEISKTSVVSVSVGIALLPGVLIMWGLYRGFRKLLNKYMQPKLKKISKNEVGIYRKNLKLTRAGGVVLNGAAGLIIASAAAGAVSTLTVPSNKSNFFNSMTNAIGDGMTFGQGQYSEAFQKMYEFIGNGNKYKNQIGGFNGAIKIEQQSNGEFSIDKNKFDSFMHPKDAAGIAALKEFIEHTNSIAGNSEEVSKSLVLMFLSASEAKEDFYLVGFDKNHADGANTVEADVIKADKNIKKSFSELGTFTESNSLGLKWDAKGIEEGITEYFGKRFKDFKTSPYFINWISQEKVIQDDSTELKKRNDLHDKLQKSIPKDKTTQADYLKEIRDDYNSTVLKWNSILDLYNKIGKADTADYADAIFGNKPTPDVKSVWGVKITKTDNVGNKTVEDLIDGLSDLSSVTRTLTKGSYYDQDNAHKIYDSKSRAAEAAQAITDNANGAYKTAKTHTDEVQKQRDDLNKDISSINQHISDDNYFINTDAPEQIVATQKLIGSATKEINDLNDEINRLNGQLVSLNALESTKKGEADRKNTLKQEADRNLNEAKGKTQGLNTSLAAAKSSKEMAETKSRNAEAKVERLQRELSSISQLNHPDEYSQKQDELNAAKTALATDNDDKDLMVADYNIAKSACETNVKDIAKFSDACSIADSAWKKANDNYEEAKQNVISKNNEITNKQTTLADKKTELQKRKLEKADKERSIVDKQNEVGRLNSELKEKEASKVRKETELKQAHADDEIAYSYYQKKLGISKPLVDAVAPLLNDYHRLRTIYDNQRNKINGYMSLIENSIKDAKEKITDEAALSNKIYKDTMTFINLNADHDNDKSIIFEKEKLDNDREKLKTLEAEKNAYQNYYNQRKRELIWEFTKLIS